MENTKQQVRDFYDRIGWSQQSDGLYQNARYEDLRPVSRDYIHKCHLRVQRHLAPRGRFAPRKLAFRGVVLEPSFHEARRIAATLQRCGHQAYLVGGCVRDLLLGREPKDYDVATSARPDEILRLFPHSRQVGAHCLPGAFSHLFEALISSLASLL